MAKYELTGGGAEYWKRERKKRRNERMKIKSDKNVKGTRSDGSAESRKANRARKDKLKAKKRGQAEKRHERANPVRAFS